MKSLESIKEPSDMIIIKITSDEGRNLLLLSNIEMKLINYIALCSYIIIILGVTVLANEMKGRHSGC